MLVQKIVDHEKADKVVYLGDWFDEFGDTPGQARQTALWIKARQKTNPEDEWIWGNHDLPYAYPYRIVQCSGNTELKGAAINDVLQPDDWAKFKFHTWVGPYLCTHAGLHPSHIEGLDVKNLREHLATEEKKAITALKNVERHWFYCAGYARGGSKPFGGITWLDFNSEFVSIPGVDQIFGHTDMWGYHRTRKGHIGELHTDKSKNYCIDTHSMYYARWNGTKLDILYVPDEVPNWRTPPINVYHTVGVKDDQTP